MTTAARKKQHCSQNKQGDGSTGHAANAAREMTKDSADTNRGKDVVT